MRLAAILGLSLLCGCLDASQNEAQADLFVSGTAPTALSRGDVDIRLTRADLAFGPLTLCAGLQAGELCEEALVEWNDAARVNVLDEQPRRVGRLEGVTGRAQSYMYDLGIVSLLTSEQPLVLDAASELGSSSVWLEGAATRAGQTLRFRIVLAIRQGGQTERGVPVVRKSGAESFSHRVRERGDALTVQFDAAHWVKGVDFATLLNRCTVDLDCNDVVTLDESSQAGAAVRNAVVAGTRPSFRWSSDDTE